MGIEVILTGGWPSAAKRAEPRKRIDDEAAVAILKEHYALYVANNPFKPGDLVTTRTTSGDPDAGNPMIVVEAFEDAHEDVRASSPRNIALCYCGSDGSIGWGAYHHSLLEPWSPRNA